MHRRWAILCLTLALAEPVTGDDRGVSTTLVSPCGPTSPPVPSEPMADPLRASQWYLRVPIPRSPDAGSINAEGAWKHVRPAEPVVIALLDSGVNWTHPDLARNIWLNRGEATSGRPGDEDDPDIPPGVRDLNGKDDDVNGFADDIHGWDFASGDYNPSSETFRGNDDHGSAMASLMAAVPDNGIGLAGVGRNVRVMPIRVLGDFKAVIRETIPQGIRYAVRNGARVIVTGIVLQSEVADPAFLDALRECERRGVLFVWAAGGVAKIDEDMAPLAGFSNVLIVGGSKRDGSLLPYDGGCKMIGIVAPAEDLTTCNWGTYQKDFGGPCPASAIAAAATATLMSQRPEMSPRQVIERIRQTSRRHPSMDDRTSGGLLDMEALLGP